MTTSVRLAERLSD